MEPSTVQQMSNQVITENEKPKLKIKNRLPVVPYDQMFPFMTPAIGQDKTNELEALFDKYKRDEMHHHTFFSLMQDIVGKEVLSSATTKLLEQKTSQQVTGNKRPRTEIRKQLVPFDQLFPFLNLQIDSDKANEIQTLADQYERGEIPEHTSVPLLKAILGEQMIRSAGAKLLEQKKSNQQVAVNQQPFDQLVLCLIPQIDHDKAIEIQTLVHKYQRREVPKYNFLPHMKRILGEQMLRSAGAKLLEQKSKLEFTVIGQPGIQIKASNLKVPLDQLVSSLIPQVDADKAIELQTLAETSKRGEISSYNVVQRMKGIVGEQILTSATEKVLAEKFNLHVPVHEQPRTQINSSNLVVPSGPLFQFLTPRIDAGKAIELQTLGYKYERGEIPKCDLLSHMESIMGEQILRSAAEKVRAKKRRISTGSSGTSLYIEV